MTTVNRPNRDALNRALDLFRDAMRPFIVRCLRSVRGGQVDLLIAVALRDRAAEQFRANLHKNDSVEAAIDINDFPHLVQQYWRDAFGHRFDRDRSVISKLWLIVEGRNQAVHADTRDMELADAITHMTHVADVLGKMNSPNEKREVEDIRDGLLSRPDSSETPLMPERTEETPQPPERPSTEAAVQSARSSGSLKPWREVIRPNADVALGTFHEAEFVADLQQVYDGRANANEYGNPVRFFDNTYITPGMRTLLLNTMRRIGGNGGDPVIQTKTGFGGGKTHSLIALYHLVSNAEAILNPSTSSSSESSDEIRDILREAGLESETGLVEASVSVLDGTFLATTDPTTTEQGDPLNTLWGVMAYQLGGQETYEIVGEAARQGTAPGGSQIDRLFEHVGPCIILMDELVAYVRNAGNARDSIYTFIQSLTQSVRRSSNAALVVTLPEHAVEAGGEAGMEALARLEHIFGRIEAIWEPLEVNEAFEVVRRRLFGSAIDETERDRTCEAFSKMYGQTRRDYPREVAEQRYLDRMKACYPIHPEIFDRLYSDWSSIPRFQRTRGVLRMMANCVSRLDLIQDSSPLIMPGSLRLDDPALGNEFLSLLGEQWRAVLSEVDSDGSRTDDIDRSSQRFGAVGGASRRVARAIFLGSAPSGAFKGIDEPQIRLGVVQPRQGVSVYNEARNRMVGDLYYMYVSDGRYYFHAEENLNKVATDRSAAMTAREVDDYILRQVRDAVGRRAEVIVFPQEPSEVPDTDSVRLVILPPGKSLTNRASESDDATPEALKILADGDRVRRNTLLFLAAKKDEVRNLMSRVRNLLAWDSILNGDRRIENLEGDRRVQAIESNRQAEQDVRSALVRAYRWTMAPVQDDPQTGDYRMNVSETAVADTGEIAQSAFDKFISDEALVEQMSPSALDNLLQGHIWSSEQHKDHIQIDALWNMMTSNVYMHRLRNKAVLTSCIESGVSDRRFGYAEGYDPDSGANPYGDDMRFGQPLNDSRQGVLGISGTRYGLLVNPEMAEMVKEEQEAQRREQERESEPETQPHDDDPPTESQQTDGGPPVTATPRLSRLIVVNKTVQNDIDLNDISNLREEIIRNLGDDGGEITISITVSAQKQDGFSESITRSIRENAVQLGLEFEETQ